MNEMVLLEKAETSKNQLVVFLPGISGKAHSGRFDGVVRVAHAAGYDCARLDLWGEMRDVQTLSYEQLFNDLNEIFAEFEKAGYEKIILIGKSFGGGLALVYQHPLISRKVMWAPAIGVAAGSGDFGAVYSLELASIENILDIHVGSDFLAMQTAELALIHGTADEVMPLSNSEAIRSFVPSAKLIVIDGADHSFRSSEHETQLLEATRNLLQ